jgi:hypothetical protein
VVDGDAGGDPEVRGGAGGVDADAGGGPGVRGGAGGGGRGASASCICMTLYSGVYTCMHGVGV